MSAPSPHGTRGTHLGGRVAAAGAQLVAVAVSVFLQTTLLPGDTAGELLENVILPLA